MKILISLIQVHIAAMTVLLTKQSFIVNIRYWREEKSTESISDIDTRLSNFSNVDEGGGGGEEEGRRERGEGEYINFGSSSPPSLLYKWDICFIYGYLSEN